MKALKLTIYSAATLLVTVIMTGCSRYGDNRNAVLINNFAIDETIKSASRSYIQVNDGNDTIYAMVSTSVMWPEKLGDHSLSTLQDTIKARMFPGITGSRSIDSAITCFVSNTDVFEAGRFTPVDSIGQSLAAEMAWYLETNGKIIDMNDRMVTYQINSMSYTGGAHPNSMSQPFTYDLKRGVVLTASNMFVKDSETALLAQIKEALAAQMNTTVEKLDEAGIFVDQLTFLGMPYIMEDAIVFHYNPYDIAPYAAGAIDVNIWATEIEQYLTPETKELVIN